MRREVAGLPGQLPGDLRHAAVGNGRAGKPLAGRLGLGHQHPQPVGPQQAPPLPVQQELGFGRVVDQIEDPLQRREDGQIHRGDPGVGVHTHRGGVDDVPGVGVSVQVLIVVRPGAGDGDDLSGAQVLQHGVDGQGGPAGAQHQHLLAADLGPGGAEEVQKAVIVGVVPVQGAVGPLHDGVDAADALRRRGEGPAEGHHCLFIGDGDVQPPEIPPFQEGTHLLRRQLHQLIVVAGQPAVDGGGEAVPQVLPQQAVLQLCRPHQQMTSL